MNLKRTFSLLIAMLLVFCVGCQNNTPNTSNSNEALKEEEIASYESSMSLLFCDSDILNPYEAETEINRQLCRLIFDCLIKTDNEFNPVYCLANSVKIKGKTCTVNIKDAKFSDGSSLNADDVLYSFKLAKKSKTSYRYKLYNVESASVVSNKTVKFNLDKKDPYVKNVLDFPIIKKGSDDRTDSDGVVLPTIGSGRYYAKDDYSKLVINNKYYGKKGSIKKINLVTARDKESISHYIEIGAADMYYTDISDGDIIRMAADKYNINLNNLVFIGVNSKYAPLKNTQIRYAISSAISRKDICNTAYFTNASAATGFFNPVWKETASVQNIQIEANQKITIENLSEIGYNSLDRKGYYVNSSGNPLSLTLLVNSNNAMRVLAAEEIAKQLNNAGIKITVIKKKYKEYLKSLKRGDFQLYLGEVNITPNMDLTKLVEKGSGVSYGVAFNKKADKDNDEEIFKNKSFSIIKGFYDGKNTINDVATVLQTEMPMIPVCYRMGVLFCNKDIENIENSSVSDIYFSIESYIIKKQ